MLFKISQQLPRQHPTSPQSTRLSCYIYNNNYLYLSDKMAEFPPPSLAPLAQEVVDLLKARNETVSVAETVCLPYYSLFPTNPVSDSNPTGSRRSHLSLSTLRPRSVGYI